MGKNIKHSRYESIIQDTINRSILFDVNDKTAKFGRVTYVELSGDLSFVDCYIDCLDREKINSVIQSLNKVSGLFRSKIASNIDAYKTPKIRFKIDKTIDYAKNIDIIINNINKVKKDENN